MLSVKFCLELNQAALNKNQVKRGYGSIVQSLLHFREDDCQHGSNDGKHWFGSDDFRPIAQISVA